MKRVEVTNQNLSEVDFSRLYSLADGPVSMTWNADEEEVYIMYAEESNFEFWVEFGQVQMKLYFHDELYGNGTSTNIEITE